MRELYLVRHAQLAKSGALTPEGIVLAQAVGALLPKFDVTTSGGDMATDQTARYMTGRESTVDVRAGIGQEFAGYENDMQQFERLPKKGGLRDYIQGTFAGGALGASVSQHAFELDRLVDETLRNLDDQQSALIVSYGPSIVSAMFPRYQLKRPIMPCYGFRLERLPYYRSVATVTRFAPATD